MTIWTPSGERPIRPPDDPAAPAGAAPAGSPPGQTPPMPAGYDDEPTEQEMAEQIAAVQQQVLRTPAEVLVANQCMGLVEIAALYMSGEPPRLTEAQLAIDALAAMVDSLGNRLGQAERPMREALSQIRLAYLEAKGSAG